MPKKITRRGGSRFRRKIFIHPSVMRTGRLKSPLPKLAAHARAIMKSQHINVNGLAKMMNVRQPTASYLLKRDDWYVSELVLVGELLGTNLFEFYTPRLREENAQMRQRISELEDEMKLIKHENALLKDIVGRK